MRWVATAAAVVLAAVPLRAGTLNVPGTYPTIQAALDHAHDSDTVLVQPGTYHEALVLPSKFLFLVAAGGPDVTIVDASGLNARPLTFKPLPHVSVSMQGFTLTGGQVPSEAGGGVFVEAGETLTLQDCTIANNSAWIGGGMFLAGFAKVDDCRITGNQASLYGGGVSGYSFQLDDCLISGNVAGTSGGGASNGYFTHCSFEHNVAGEDGGGAAGIEVMQQLVDCTFRENVAGGVGGGVAMTAFGTAFQGVSLSRCVFIGNQAHGGGGASILGKPSAPSIIMSASDCIFTGNTATFGDGLLTDSQAASSSCVRFCSFAGDSVQAVGGLSIEHCIARDPPAGEPFVSAEAGPIAVAWSDVQGGWPGLGNFDADPQFLDPVAGDLHLSFTSPCADAGDPAFVIGASGTGCDAPALDIDGEPRIQKGRVDVGADESQGDCNGNGVGDLIDIASGSSTDCDADGVPDDCQPFVDCNGNGLRDSCELQAGTAQDCNGNGIPDECDIAAGTSQDADGDGVPDECELQLHVPGDFPDIQSAIAAAQDTNTIVVAPGTWSGSGNVELDFLGKLLTLQGGGDAKDCILDGGGQFGLVQLGAAESRGVTLRQLTLRNGVASQGGAVLCADGALLLAEDCRFEGCTADQGGAVSIRDGASATLTGCTFSGNHAHTNGGALRFSTATGQVEHCSFEANEAASQGGTLRAQAGSLVTVIDSILHGGMATSGMELSLAGTGTLLSISYSDVAGGEAGIVLGHHVWGTGMIDAAPLFADAAASDFHLLPGSPCINTGDPSGADDPDGSPPDMGALSYEPWTVLGGGIAGSFGLPLLSANGPLTADSTVTWSLANGPPGAGFLLVVGFSPADVPFKGGVLWPMPDALIGLSFGHGGLASGMGRWPPGVPSGSGLWLQAWLPDDGAPEGLAASDGVRGLAP